MKPQTSVVRPSGKILRPAEQTAVAYLRSPQAIRDRCGQLFHLACEDQSQHFACDLGQLAAVVNYVLQITQARYPDLQIPFHSRWRHFEVGQAPRLAHLEQALAGLSPIEKAQSKFDLAIVSVLLDAGAGVDWYYLEPKTGQCWRRSEGLAVASFYCFCGGQFSGDPKQPYQVEAQRLQTLSEAELAAGFQVSDTNPLIGLAGRRQLLQQLGHALSAHPDLFAPPAPDAAWRPGNLVYSLLSQSHAGTLAASTVFAAVVAGLSDIWPGGTAIAGVNLGDVWLHPQLPGQGLGEQLVPFHKLSLWLTYSLLEPLQELGLTITGLDALTGLPEYRNGGLCLDLGLLKPKHSGVTQGLHAPGSSVVVEWRALTIVLLDQIAEAIRQQCHRDAEELPLVKILQGGTWSAGRQIAATLRSGSQPPIQLQSDGTVF